MTSALAIYDMDKTVTRRATYTPFLLHAAPRLAPWRLLLLPVVLVTMLAYALKLIDRGRLKELNYRLLIGRDRARAAGAGDRELRRRAARHQHPARRPRARSPRTRPPGGGWSWRPPPTGSTPRRSPSGSASTTSSRTETRLDARGPDRRPDRRRQLLRRGQARHDPGLAAARRAGARRGPHPLLFRPRLRRAASTTGPTKPSPPTPTTA